jgi:hypothetical protein
MLFALMVMFCFEWMQACIGAPGTGCCNAGGVSNPQRYAHAVLARRFVREFITTAAKRPVTVY